MFKCKAKDLTPTTEEDSGTIQVSQEVLQFYNDARLEGFEGTIEEFVDQAVAGYFRICARLKGKKLVRIEYIF